MPRSLYEAYGDLADAPAVGYTESAGRYGFMAQAERHIVADVATKLALQPDDRLLEIGCGAGNLLIPLSFRVQSVTGVDHPRLLARLHARFPDNAVTLLPGFFPDVAPAGPFEKILCYSVLQNLPDTAAVFAAVDHALTLLTPGGRLMIGDMPNVDLKQRFQSSAAGQAFAASWAQQSAGWQERPAAQAMNAAFEKAQSGVLFDDALVLALAQRARAQGCHSFVVPQDPHLPFGNSREDLLIVRP